MLHSSRIHVPSRSRQRFAVRTIFPTTSFSPPDSKEPLRRSIMFSTIAIILLLIGCILTWLGFNDVFGGKISMTGPLLITLAMFMLLLSCRQFLLFRKRNGSSNQLDRNTGSVTAVVVDHDDGNGAATIVMETYHSPLENGNGCQRRTCDDLAPPSYMDIAQLSCSSNCPSFISHDDRNEAPPTYEETCPGVVAFGSESSLATTATHWRRSSSQLTHTPSPRHSARGFFDNDKHFVGGGSCHKATTISGYKPPPCICVQSQRKGSETLCPPSPTALVRPSVSLPNQTSTPSSSSTSAFLPTQRSLDSSSLAPGKASLTAQSSLDSTVLVPHVSLPSQGSLDSSSVLVPQVSLPTQHSLDSSSPTPLHRLHPSGSSHIPLRGQSWSRRSFSSIPSYTCLLSESGEVSAQVYNTSSIIEEMMPSVPDTGTSQHLLGGATPTRSHSMSSVHTLRQGVPYDLLQLRQSGLPPRPASPSQHGVLAADDPREVNNASRCSQRSDPGAAHVCRQPTVTSGSSQQELDPTMAAFPAAHRASSGSLGVRNRSPDMMSKSMEEQRPSVIIMPERRTSNQNIGVLIKHQDIVETI